jgi:hypothetical protein
MALYGSRQRYAVNKPGQQRHEYLVSKALAVADIPGGEIEKTVAPPRNPLFPPQFGYHTNQPTIDDIMLTAQDSPDYRSSWKQDDRAPAGTSRPSGDGWY